MKVRSDGRLLNPSTTTDDNSSFVLEVDKSVLLECDYKFKLNLGLYLVSEKNVPIVFEIDEDSRKLDLGQIVIK